MWRIWLGKPSWLRGNRPEGAVRLFEELAEKRFPCRIATAHTAGDNLETLLLHLTRGSAMTGLAGIPPVRGRIIRPLIDCRRDEVEAYCREQGVPFTSTAATRISHTAATASGIG